MSTNKNSVFIATSIDGYIADKKGGLDWLDYIPEINKIDTGYDSFMSGVDALVMGRNTYETVLSFGIDWPYTKPVFVATNKLKSVPEKLKEKVIFISGTAKTIQDQVNSKGYNKLYIDGGQLVQNFLAEDLIDEMIITTIPLLLGEGIPLFSKLSKPINFECVSTKHYLGKISQNHFVRKNEH